MRMCLKCRTFYDDKVKFCLNDGVPLLNIDRTHDLWEKGTKAVRETQKTITRQIRKQSIKTTISTTITTVLTIMVVSVVALNSYVYLSPEAPPVMRAALLPPAEPTPAESPSPSPAESPTPSPSPDVTPDTPDTVDKDSDSNTNDNNNNGNANNNGNGNTNNNGNGNGNSNANSNTNYNINNNTNNNGNNNANNSSSGCSAQEKEANIMAIFIKYDQAFQNEIIKIGAEKNRAYGRQGQLSMNGTRSTVKISANCKQASVNRWYHWVLYGGQSAPPGNSPKRIETLGELKGNFIAACTNNGGSWKCTW